MKAYHVHNYWLCQITNEVVAVIGFAITNEYKEFKKRFASKTEADAYIEKEKRQWFLAALEKYIYHKKHIIDVTNDAAKQKALTVCLNAYADFEGKSLETICTRFLKGQIYFDAILPYNTNDSYEKSQHNLRELTTFCEKEIKQ